MESEIGWRVRQLARENKDKGHSIKTDKQHGRIQIDDDWFEWKQSMGKFIKKQIRNKEKPSDDKLNNVSKPSKTRKKKP